MLLECEKLGAGERDAEADGGDGGSGSEAEAEEVGDKKSKKHNKTRLLKVRLQKLVQKTDDECVTSALLHVLELTLYQRSCLVRRVHGAAKQEAVAIVLQDYQASKKL